MSFLQASRVINSLQFDIFKFSSERQMERKRFTVPLFTFQMLTRSELGMEPVLCDHRCPTQCLHCWAECECPPATGCFFFFDTLTSLHISSSVFFYPHSNVSHFLLERCQQPTNLKFRCQHLPYIECSAKYTSHSDLFHSQR